MKAYVPFLTGQGTERHFTILRFHSIRRVSHFFLWESHFYSSV